MSQEFKSGICECCNDPAGCVYTWFCYPCASGMVTFHVDIGSSNDGSSTWWFLFLLVPLRSMLKTNIKIFAQVCPWTALGYNVMQRYVIRESYGIQVCLYRLL